MRSCLPDAISTHFPVPCPFEAFLLDQGWGVGRARHSLNGQNAKGCSGITDACHDYKGAIHS
jgi:hypothetical protein